MTGLTTKTGWVTTIEEEASKPQNGDETKTSKLEVNDRTRGRDTHQLRKMTFWSHNGRAFGHALPLQVSFFVFEVDRQAPPKSSAMLPDLQVTPHTRLRSAMPCEGPTKNRGAPSRQLR